MDGPVVVLRARVLLKRSDELLAIGAEMRTIANRMKILNGRITWLLAHPGCSLPRL